MQPRSVVGSTAVLALVTASHVFVANGAGPRRPAPARRPSRPPATVGDSRAVQVRCKADGRFIPRPLSRDHKPSCTDERRRIEEAGGFVSKSEDCMRVNGVLATSRAIGDKLLKPYVNAEPEITRVRRLQGGPERDYLILATDGLWDDLTLQESAAMVEGLDSAVQADAAPPAGATSCADDDTKRPSLLPRSTAPGPDAAERHTAKGPSLVPSSANQGPDVDATTAAPPRRRRRTVSADPDATTADEASGAAGEASSPAEAGHETVGPALPRTGRARALSLADTPNPVMPDAARASRKRRRQRRRQGEEGSDAQSAGQTADSSSSPASGDHSVPGPTPQEILVRYTRLVTRRGAVDNISILVAAL